jgi:hypothetical protein
MNGQRVAAAVESTKAFGDVTRPGNFYQTRLNPTESDLKKNVFFKFYPALLKSRDPKPPLDGTGLVNLISPARWTAESKARPNIFSDLTELTERFVL